jgi:hypothetical protein
LLLALEIYFWGIGLTLLLLPARLRRFWPAFCAPAGLGLQSAVVWVGAHTAMRGTDHYGFACLLLPLALFGAAWIKLGPGRLGKALAAARKWWTLAPVMAVSFALQIYPFTKSPGLLTAEALGSCDAADYATGARVFKEFSSRDRSGFMGLTEVVRLLSIDNFFDFWLRLNHFTPSALIALNATLLDRQPFELTSVLAAVLAAIALPTVFWLLRSAFRFGRSASLLLTAICAFSPIVCYVVYQDALGQLLATPAVALLIWVGVKSYQRRRASYFGILLLANWLLLGSYNFFLLFAYVPLVACIGGRTIVERTWKRGLGWCGFVGVNLLLCAFLFPGRVLSILDRFRLFDDTPFGWPIPPFRPEGWLGVFADTRLHPAAQGWPQLVGAICLAAAGWALYRQHRRAPRVCALLAACALPIFLGYAILVWKDDASSKNAGYDAFKLFTVFYPALLAGLCLWLRDLKNSPFRARVAAWFLGVCLLALNVHGALAFNTAVRRQALVVDPWLEEIGSVERMKNVKSINVCLQEYWPRLWANYWLLRKPQYFRLPTYEGRRMTPLRGDWDLRDCLLEVRAGSGTIHLNNGFYLIRRAGPEFLDLQFAQGWYEPESFRETFWSWSKGGVSQVNILNPHPYALAGPLSFSLRALTPRHVRVSLNGKPLWGGTAGFVASSGQAPAISLPPGTSVLQFDSPEPPLPPSADDERSLSFALCGLQIDPAK